MTSASKLSITSAAREVGDQTALVIAGETWSYSRLAGEVSGVVAWLQRRFGDAPAGRRMAFLADRRFESLLLTYACLELGWTLVPLHARWQQNEKRRMVEALGLDSWLDPAEIPRHQEDAGETARALDPRQILAIMPSSGSSGKAKGVALSHGAFIASARAGAARLGWHDGDRWLLSLPLAHIGGLSILTRCLIDRRTAVLPPAGEGFEASSVLAQVNQDAVTHLSVVPLMLRRLLDAGEPPPSLRLVLVGGAALPGGWLAEARQAGWPALATYGLTEACSQVATQAPQELEDPEPRLGAPLLDGIEARLDRAGVLYLRGPSLMSGYRPVDLTLGKGLDADGWLRTGDIARLQNGRLHILGRHDQMIVTGGENVHPAEVERVLLELPEVEAAAVLGVPNEKWGQTVAAAVEAADLDVAKLEAALKKRLAGYKRPRRWLVLDQLPKTASGKVDRMEIRNLFMKTAIS